MNILLMGYYGYKNIGDDIFVNQLTDYFEKQKSVKKIFLICQDDYYSDLSPKTQLFAAPHLSKLKRMHLVLQSNIIVWGGGTLNLASKPTHLLRMQNLSKLTGKRFGFLGIGLESLNSESKPDIATIFKNADILYVRDQYSYNFVSQELNDKQFSCLGGDLAFLDLNFYNQFITPDKDHSQLKHISFCGKKWWGQGRADFYAQQLLPVIEKYNSVIHLLPGQNFDEERDDNRFHKLLASCLPEAHYQLHSWEKPEDFLEILSQMDFHIGNRLHSIILADILGVPNIGIGESYSKIANYIAKSEILSTERTAAFMEPISIDRIEKIVKLYQRPNDFIKNESLTAQECLKNVLTF